MSTQQSTCPDEMMLHAWVDDRDETLDMAKRDAITAHLERCADCDEQVLELRKFRTLLLRTRVPPLNEGQWRMVDARVEMLAAEPPPRGGQAASRIYWGVAIAAVLSIFAVGGWQVLQQRGDGPTTTLSNAGQARVAAAFDAVTVTVAEGSLEFAGTDGHFHPMKSGEKLVVGGQIRSFSDGRLVVANHFELRLKGASTVAILAGNKREIFLRLRHGEVACRVEKRAPGQRFGVLAGRFRASVIGTEFVVQHDKNGRVAVTVSEGAVRVDEADDPWHKVSETTSVVRAGNRWRFTGGRMELGPIMPAAHLDAAAAAAAAATTNTQTDRSSATALTARPLPQPAQNAGGAGDTNEVQNRAAVAARQGAGAPQPRGQHAAQSAVQRRRKHPAGAEPKAQPQRFGAPARADRVRPATVVREGANTDLPEPQPDSQPAAARNQDAKERRILIDLPPQAMSAEEIRRAKASEPRRRGSSSNR